MAPRFTPSEKPSAPMSPVNGGEFTSFACVTEEGIGHMGGYLMVQSLDEMRRILLSPIFVHIANLWIQAQNSKKIATVSAKYDHLILEWLIDNAGSVEVADLGSTQATWLRYSKPKAFAIDDAIAFCGCLLFYGDLELRASDSVQVSDSATANDAAYKVWEEELHQCQVPPNLRQALKGKLPRGFTEEGKKYGEADCERWNRVLVALRLLEYYREHDPWTLVGAKALAPPWWSTEDKTAEK